MTNTGAVICEAGYSGWKNFWRIVKPFVLVLLGYQVFSRNCTIDNGLRNVWNVLKNLIKNIHFTMKITYNTSAIFTKRRRNHLKLLVLIHYDPLNH